MPFSAKNMPKGVVRVKIGVAIDSSGRWSCIGYDKMQDDEIYMAGDALDADARYYWLEADLAGPEIETKKPHTIINAPNEV